MRASSLSNPKVIDLLNHYFIPVHADGVYYHKNSTVPAAEKAAYEQVFRGFYQLNRDRKAAGEPSLSVGTVHAYILTPDGKPFDALHVAEAKPERVLTMLRHAIETLKVTEGKPVVEPKPQAVAPRATADTLVLHLTARYLVSRNDSRARKDADDDYVPIAAKLGTDRSGGWNALPSEDWIELKSAEWRKLLPAGPVHVGSSWDLDKDVTAQLLTRFYPTTENNDLATNRIERQTIRATVLSNRDGVIRARLDGSLRMQHNFYPHREDKNYVDATVVGYMDFETDRPRIRTLRLVTDRATYGTNGARFGAALSSP